MVSAGYLSKRGHVKPTRVWCTVARNQRRLYAHELYTVLTPRAGACTATMASLVWCRNAQKYTGLYSVTALNSARLRRTPLDLHIFARATKGAHMTPRAANAASKSLPPTLVEVNFNCFGPRIDQA